MARTTRSASKVTKPVAKKNAITKNSKKNEKVAEEIEQAVEEKEEEEEFQLPSDSESDEEDKNSGDDGEGDEDEAEDEEESDSELAVLEDVISEGNKRTNIESTNKSGHTITKPSSESKNKKKSDNNTKRGVIYIGRLPNGFEEKELKTYFQQFGDITRLRLSRNKKTGNSKHYAFIEFKEHEVAKIASETMNNYLLMGHLLKCTLLSEDKIHENLFDGANTKFKVIPFKKISLARHDKKRTIEEWEKLNHKHLASIKNKQNKLKEKGIDFDLSEL